MTTEFNLRKEVNEDNSVARISEKVEKQYSVGSVWLKILRGPALERVN